MGRLTDAPPAPHQRGPYFAIKTQNVLLVCIDTGTSGTIDREQGEWLLRMAKLEEPKNKILLTGKPLWVDGHLHPCDIRWLPIFNPDKEYAARTGSPEPVETRDEPAPPPYATVYSIVSRPEHNFIATIGGDVHNYQRFPIPIDDSDGRVAQHIVSGGGGAFMSPTHTIEHLGPDESRFRCYPLRRDSLARFAQVAARRFRRPLLRIMLASLFLWWLALQAWNPHNQHLDDPPLGPLSAPAGYLIRGANVSPGTTVWEFAPLAWFFPGADYSWWAAVVIGAIALGVGVALLVLPWFRWRVKGVFGLAAAGAALLCWHGTFMTVPGGGWTFFAVGLAAGLGIFVFSHDIARKAPVWLRLVVIAALVIGAAVTADLNFFDRGAWGLVPISLALWAAAVVLIGGPRMSRPLSAFTGAAIGLLTAILSTIPAGYGWTVIAGVAFLLLLYVLYAAVLLFRVLLPFDAIDPETAAKFLLDDPGDAVRPVDGEPGGFSVRAGRWGLLRTRWTWPLYPLEVVYPALFNHDQQPFFKNFLRVDVDGKEVKIYCFGVVEELARPTVEDHFRFDGNRWTEARAILGEDGTSPVRGEVDWYPGGEIRFTLDAEEGAEFTILSSEGDGWKPEGHLHYHGPDSLGELEDPGVTKPRKIALRRVAGGPEAQLYAEGTFV